MTGHNCDTQYDRTVLIIFTLIFQTNITAQMLSVDEEGACSSMESNIINITITNICLEI